MKKFLKSFKRWGDSRTWPQTIGWGAWLIGLAMAAFSDPVYALAGFVLLLVCMGLSIRHFKKFHTFILIGALLLSQTSFSRAQPPKKQAVVECNAVVIGILVIAVGGIILYKVVQFCKKHFPTPPPPPPLTPPDTNAPPVTNSPSPFPAAQMRPSYEPTSCDISTNGWMDNTDPANPTPFQDFITLSFSSSSDLTNWTNCCTINLWLSSNSVESVIYDWRGVTLGTNYTRGNPYAGQSLTNRLPFQVDMKQHQQFYRDY